MTRLDLCFYCAMVDRIMACATYLSKIFAYTGFADAMARARPTPGTFAFLPPAR
jgi:hypothetical protein